MLLEFSLAGTEVLFLVVQFGEPQKGCNICHGIKDLQSKGKHLVNYWKVEQTLMNSWWNDHIIPYPKGSLISMYAICTYIIGLMSIVNVSRRKMFFNVLLSGRCFIHTTASQLRMNVPRSSLTKWILSKSSVPYRARASSFVLKYRSNINSTWQPRTMAASTSSWLVNLPPPNVPPPEIRA